MKLIKAHSKDSLKKFYKLGEEIYSNNKFYRSTEEDVLKLIIEGPTKFHKHSKVEPYIILVDNKIVCRFVFILDARLPDYVQVAFFEAKAGLNGLIDFIIDSARSRFQDCNRICFGLNGHLNYGAGILLNNYDKVPTFGLPYTESYYPEYFSKLIQRNILSLSFPFQISDKYKELKKRLRIDKNITIRKLNKKQFKQDSELYTELNNSCFQNHPFWSNRDAEEDFELFEPFKHLLKNENLIFAEYNGKPIGFLLWLPDFNQLVKTNRELKSETCISFDVIRYKYFNPITTFRFTEIAVDPKYRKMGAEMALINQMIQDVGSAGYKNGVGGFIFEENLDSINMAIKYIERITGENFTADSKYAIYEAKL